MKEFFFRVASLAFEGSVLSELEKGGSRQIGDVVREYLCGHLWKNKNLEVFMQLDAQLIRLFCFCFSGINSNSKNLYTTTKKKQSNCCQ